MIPKKVCDMLCGEYSINGKCYDAAMLILRVAVGFAFIYHGWAKVGNMENAIQMFSNMQVGVVLAYIASYVEFLGGIAILLGGLTRLATTLLGIFMVVAIYLVHLNNGYNAMAGGFEYQLLLIVCLVVMHS
jgi:putative oxidoreductase